MNHPTYNDIITHFRNRTIALRFFPPFTKKGFPFKISNFTGNQPRIIDETTTRTSDNPRAI